MKGKVFKEFQFKGVVDGSIMQFREIVNPQPRTGILCANDGFFELEKSGEFKPLFKAGEKVYIKEPYAVDFHDKKGKYFTEYYKFSDSNLFLPTMKWLSSITMPAKYARYFIEITDVRCEQLQDISDEDCLKSGIKKYGEENPVFGVAEIIPDNIIGTTPKEACANLINKIHGKGTWEANPYVWVYDFKLIDNKTNNIKQK